MSAPLFIGDTATAAGFRLAGLAVETPPPEGAARALAAAQADGAAPLVVLTAEYARAIPQETLRAAIRSMAPPVAIVGDAGGRVPVPDLTAHVRAAVGLG
jgi:vacuolar-type H+-ATPase subunit F/Vma7